MIWLIFSHGCPAAMNQSELVTIYTCNLLLPVIRTVCVLHFVLYFVFDSIDSFLFQKPNVDCSGNLDEDFTVARLYVNKIKSEVKTLSVVSIAINYGLDRLNFRPFWQRNLRCYLNMLFCGLLHCLFSFFVFVYLFLFRLYFVAFE